MQGVKPSDFCHASTKKNSDDIEQFREKMELSLNAANFSSKITLIYKYVYIGLILNYFSEIHQ